MILLLLFDKGFTLDICPLFHDVMSRCTISDSSTHHRNWWNSRYFTRILWAKIGFQRSRSFCRVLLSNFISFCDNVMVFRVLPILRRKYSYNTVVLWTFNDRSYILLKFKTIQLVNFWTVCYCAIALSPRQHGQILFNKWLVRSMFKRFIRFIYD